MSHFFVFIFLLLEESFFFFEPAVDQSRQQRAGDRRDPEQPELSQRPPDNEYYRISAARRVDRQVGHWDADQVDQ